MIITKILGGLGNQMFQYSAGRALAERLGVELKLDISAFDSYELRDYWLSFFNINVVSATDEEINLLAGSNRNRKKKKSFLEKFFGGRDKLPVSYFKDDPIYLFNEKFSALPDNIYLNGYWQNQKYFNDIKEVLNKEFSLKEELSGESKEVLEKIETSTSVSLHIRRGDYATNEKVNNIYGLCTLDYYKNAIECIEKSHGNNLEVFVFSDDTAWVNENLEINNQVTVVDHNGPERCYEDMILMSRCRHNVIANSTFSWWGAWLNSNKDKTVISPKKWFQSDKYDTSDLIPTDWIRL